ncbi:hypothetical protein BGX28_009960 [Mortierella sp. GBA30]|nr:hypothetical protein BGX28_009960 [Mortierella sp. GBA30]
MAEARQPTDVTNIITLFCVVIGEHNSNAFSVEILATKTVDHLKKLIKVAKAPKFDDVAADELTLWSTSIPISVDEEESAVVLDTQDKKMRLHPASELSEVFGDNLPKKTIHIIVHRPPSVPKLSSRIKLRVVIKKNSKRELSWVADANTATVKELQDTIFRDHPDLDDGPLSITIRHQKTFNHPSSIPAQLASDQQLRNILWAYIEDGLSHLTLDLNSPSKSYSAFTWNEVHDEYGKNRIHKYEFYSNVILETDDQHQALNRLCRQLKMWHKVIGDPVSEAEASIYIACFLGHAASSMEVSCEAKATEWKQGLAQNIVQLESALTERWRSFDCAPGDTTALVSYGIVTTASLWYFVQCAVDPTTSSPIFHYSRLPVTFSFNGEYWEKEAKDIFTRILWLLDAMLSEVPNREKKHKK